jgi:hypothetical protein
MTANGEPTPKNQMKFWAVATLGLLAAVLAVHGVVLSGGLFVEKDFLWLSAGDLGAQWAPYMDHMDELFQRPIMRALHGARPGTWLFHVVGGTLFGGDPRGRLLMLFLVLAADGLLVAILANQLYGNRKLALAAGLFFAIHPALSSTVATISSGPALASTFWILAACIALLRFKKAGRGIHLVAVVSCAFLAYATTSLGVVAVPALLLLDLATLSPGKKLGQLAMIGFRFAITAGTVAAFGMFWFAIGGARELAQIMVASRHFSTTLTLLGEAWQRLLLPIPMKWDSTGGSGAINLGQMVLFLAPVLLGIGLAAVFKKRIRLFAFGILVIGVPFQAGILLTVRAGTPEYGMILLPSAIGMVLLLGEIAVAPLSAKRTKFRYAIPVLLAGLLAFSASANAMHWADKGRQVQRMARQMAKIHQELPEAADLFLLSSGRRADALLCAHLEYSRNFGMEKKARFTFVSTGQLLLGASDKPVGESPRGLTRLPLDPAMFFFGWDSKSGLSDLTSLMNKKVDQATAFMKNDRCLPEPIRLGNENTILSWKPGCTLGWENMTESDLDAQVWYVEGAFVSLHPRVGRFL